MDICHSPESGTPGAPLRPKSSAPRSGFVQQDAGPNDEERGQSHVPLRMSLARSSSSVSFAFGQMNRIPIDTHRSLFFVIFGVFEALLLGAVVVHWSVDPRGLSGLDDAAGVTFWFSFLGLSIVSWLLRRGAPRLAVVGFATVLTCFVVCSFLPAVK